MLLVVIGFASCRGEERRGSWETKRGIPPADLTFRRPERWDNPPAATSAIPSVYANLTSFLAGPRACIGWRVALIEYVSRCPSFSHTRHD